jgi:hypothetical protein
MPRFFFNFHAGNAIAQDDEGTEAPNLEAARTMAIASAREVLADNIKSASARPMEAITITDETGKELMTVLAKDVLPEQLK